MIKELFADRDDGNVMVVCVPPGARLRVHDISESLQHSAEVGAVEDATFTQLTAEGHMFRDAVRFDNGREVLLQQFDERQRVTVLCMDVTAERPAPAHPETRATSVRD